MYTAMWNHYGVDSALPLAHTDLSNSVASQKAELARVRVSRQVELSGLDARHDVPKTPVATGNGIGGASCTAVIKKWPHGRRRAGTAKGWKI